MNKLNVTLLGVILVALAANGLAQTTVGSISGTVTDASGALFPDASITVTNLDTNETRHTVTDATGFYRVLNLLPGRYDFRAEHAGFKTFENKGVTLTVTQAARLDVILEPGKVRQEVTVSGGAVSQVTLENADLGTLVSAKQTVELPLNGRNFLQLAYLSPGAQRAIKTQVTGRGAGPNTFGLELSGGQATNNSYLIDGIESSGFRFRNTGIAPSVDMVQEFNVQTSPYDPQYGFYSNGQINVATKSGTSKFHGNVYEFHRNSAVDARNFFDVNKPAFKRNQFGWTLGGPAAREGTFFFVSNEWLRSRKGVTATTQVPTAEERAGDFSSDPKAVIDPATGQPFPNNIIPADRINPISRRLIDLYPLPNRPQRPNFVNTQSDRLNSKQFSGRLDHQFSQRWSMFARYTFQKVDELIPGAIPNFGVPLEVTAQNAVFTNTFTFSPTFLAEFRIGYNRDAGFDSSEQVGKFRGNQELGIQGLLPIPPEDDGYPNVPITGFGTIGDLSFAPESRAENFEQFVLNLTKIKGRHTVRTGFDIRPQQLNAITLVPFSRGVFTFTNFLTKASTGLPEFLLGLPNIAQRTISFIPGSPGFPRADLRATLFAFYVGDTYKVSPRLTLNLGLRYELDQPFVDKQNRVSVFVPDGFLNPKPGQILIGGDPSNGFGGRRNRSLYPYDTNNWSPRFGFAYDLFGDGKTALRGGYGIYFNLDEGNALFLESNNIPFRVDQTFLANASLGKLLDFSAPFPANIGTGVSGGRNLAADFRNAYLQQWSLGIQRQFGNSLVADVSYVGSKGTRLGNIRWVNQGAAPGTPNAPFIKPFPDFGLFLTTFSNGLSNYNSLQAKLRKTYSSGLSFLASYTYSHSIDNTPGVAASTEQFFPQNTRNLRAERASSDFDQRHLLVLSGIYQLPIGPGHQFLGNLQGAWRKLLEGWQVGGIWTSGSGTPFTPRVSGNRSLTGGGTDRPNRICDGNISSGERSRTRYFDTSCFVVQPLGQFGDSGRNVINGPTLNNLDFSLDKSTRVGERVTAQFRTEIFNIFNHTNFGGPNIFANSSNFGIITSAGDPRNIQFGLKISF